MKALKRDPSPLGSPPIDPEEISPPAPSEDLARDIETEDPEAAEILRRRRTKKK